MTLYRSILQFVEDGPGVSGEWKDNPAAVVQFVADEYDGTRRIIRKWVVDRERHRGGRSVVEPAQAVA
ncbi:hypothetical protein FE633_17465 [Streptomyces montanus]|uniref:Uncharacterized protein n=1 Tax=Streptomyces montanus TaxID=2580423 RepID=A0A5R9FWS1_9ACTN|nr:hypothetical protein [Streptomyces montanus]TLS44934.1 hypothetical protein FE633_17465 [Streptomyces montanus]